MTIPLFSFTQKGMPLTSILFNNEDIYSKRESFRVANSRIHRQYICNRFDVEDEHGHQCVAQRACCRIRF